MNSNLSTPTSLQVAAKVPRKHKRKDVNYAMVYGYPLDPACIYRQALEDGTAIVGQPGSTFGAYRLKIAQHCGIDYDAIISIRHPEKDMSPIYCIFAATNLSKRSKVPNQHIINKAKEFLNTTEEPKWHYVVRE